MERIPTQPPKIEPLPNNKNRPLWSVMIPVYNCIKYIPDVLQSVLVQSPAEDIMQIEVVDDASTDGDVEGLVRQIGKGRIKYYKQPKNVGSLRNFETCLNRAQGKLVHLLHGDDRVLPGFYKKMDMLFQQYPEAGAAFCRFRNIDQDGKIIDDAKPETDKEGIIQDWFYRIAAEQRTQYVAMVVKREVYENVGSFYGMTYGEDWEMWVRIAKSYPVAYTPELLAEYRKHSGSISNPQVNDGKITKDVVKVISLIKDHLPEEKKHIMRSTEEGTAVFCLMHADNIWRATKNKALAENQIKLAMSLPKSVRLYYHIMKLQFKMALNIK